MNAVLILAIDPGTIDTGIAFGLDQELYETSTLHVPKSWKAIDRVIAMMDKIEEKIRPHTDLALLEGTEIHLPFEMPRTFHGEDGAGRPIISLHNLCALIQYWASKCGYVTTFPYDVADIKEGVAGDRRASKDAMERILRLERTFFTEAQFEANPDIAGCPMPSSNNEWDAISIWTYHVRQLSVKAAIM